MGLSNRAHNNGFTRGDLLTLGVLCVIDKTNTVADIIQKCIVDSEACQTLVQIEALDKGIVPSRDSIEIRRYLESVDYEERTKLKRKFRKLQRKFRKKVPGNEATDFYGEKDKIPNKLQKHRRKHLVFSSLLNEYNA